MTLTRKTLEVATLILGILDEVPKEDRDNVLDLLIETAKQDRTALPSLEHIRASLNRVPPQGTPEEPSLDNGSRPLRPTRRTRTRHRHASPQVLEELNQIPKGKRRLKLTNPQRRNLKRNLDAYLEEHQFSNQDLAVRIRKQGYLISAATISNLRRARYGAIFRMTLRGIAAVTRISPEELLSRHA